MDPLEEQAQELEVLESIYPDELERKLLVSLYIFIMLGSTLTSCRTEISSTEFTLHLKLDTTPVQYINLLIEYPVEYPEIVPLIQVEVGEKWIRQDGGENDEEEPYEEEDEEENEALPFSAIAPALLELTAHDCIALKKSLEESAEENVGMASVFTLASLVKEEAEAVVQEKLEAAEKEREKEILRQEAEEQKKFIGTPVNEETFSAWRLKFREEFKLDEKDHVHTIYDSKGQPKLTGRQMFERGLSKFEDEEEDDIEAGVNSLKV